jgi:hypothetical protein
VCPGYQQRLQWSTKYEYPQHPRVNAPTDFNQLVSAVSAVIESEYGGETRRRTGRSSSSSLIQAQSNPIVLQNEEVSTLNQTSDAGSRTPNASPSADDQPPWMFPIDENALTILQPTASDPFLPSLNIHEPFYADEIGTADQDNSLTSYSTISNDGLIPRFNALQRSTLERSLVHLPTFLIEHWFKSVCSMWSAFDSQDNPYRRLASGLWTSSKAVYFALQSMSAASLVDHMPHLRAMAISAPRMAAQAISEELGVFSARKGRIGSFPSSLVLSLFCMSSSVCWTNHEEYGHQYLKQARNVLNRVKRKSSSLGDQDLDLFRFFHGCLIYEEVVMSMATNVISDGSSLNEWRTSLPQSASVTPHPWTGVSPDVFGLFGKVLLLCQKSCARRNRDDSMTMKCLEEAMKDIQDAIQVEEILLAIEAPPIEVSADALAEEIARSHLRDATEAYRLCSLLLLYQTFPDLVARRIPSQVAEDGLVPDYAWLSPLALHITNILKRIPHTSSMRCIQPLLCLCAGSGLRFYEDSPSEGFEDSIEDQIHENICQGFSYNSIIPEPVSLEIDQFCQESVVTQNTLQIGHARQFLTMRLNSLEHILPSKPLSIAKQLLRAVWAVFDEEGSTSHKTHWLDIMTNTGLKTHFG